MCSGIFPEMFAKTAPTSSLLPVPSCQQRRRRRCPHSPMLADSRSALPCLLRRPSARYPHEKNVTVHPRHPIVMNRAFGVACFSFFISLADSRSALPCLLRRPSARYPHEKNKCRLRRRLFFFRAGYIIPQVAINFNKTPCTIP